MDYRRFILGLSLLIIVTLTIYSFHAIAGKIAQSPSAQTTTHKVTTSPERTFSVSPGAMPSPTVTLTMTSPQAATFYPITNYASRITNRWYGKLITAADSKSLACGQPYQGYHTGDDLEVTKTELNQPVPVFAIARGTVLSAGPVSGYGGLIVIEHNLGNQTVTAYYGHINLSQTTVTQGQTVQAGQQITVLGDNCSSQTGGERKHLHFAIHQGSAVDVRGYVPNQATLANWLNPKENLASLNAQTP